VEYLIFITNLKYLQQKICVYNVTLPSVMQTIKGISASIASFIAAAAPGGGT